MMNEEEILKNVLSGRMTREERKNVSEQDIVIRHLKSQWDDSRNDSVLDPKAKDRVLDRITKKIHGHKSFTERWGRYGIAASLALLFSVGYWLAGPDEPDSQIVYVVNAGRQSMESFYLPDGSHVSLNAGSKLTYPEHFSGKNREIYLSGQAFFKVHHDTEHPFIVKTKSMDIKALGTSFEVFSVDSTSYTEMILSGGAVEVSTKRTEGEGDVFLVFPDEKLAYELNGKAEIEKVKGELAQFTDKKLIVDIKEIKRPDKDAQLVAENIALQLENRISFRRAMKSCMSRTMKSGALGVKTSVSGRLGGADMARTEFYSEGTIPLQTLRADIDYGFAEADTTYGKVGVKVWIYKGEVLPTKEGKEGGTK